MDRKTFDEIRGEALYNAGFRLEDFHHGMPIGRMPLGGMPLGGMPLGGMPLGGMPIGGSRSPRGKDNSPQSKRDSNKESCKICKNTFEANHKFC